MYSKNSVHVLPLMSTLELHHMLQSQQCESDCSKNLFLLLKIEASRLHLHMCQSTAMCGKANVFQKLCSCTAFNIEASVTPSTVLPVHSNVVASPQQCVGKRNVFQKLSSCTAFNIEASATPSTVLPVHSNVWESEMCSKNSVHVLLLTSNIGDSIYSVAIHSNVWESEMCSKNSVHVLLLTSKHLRLIYSVDSPQQCVGKRNVFQKLCSCTAFNIEASPTPSTVLPVHSNVWESEMCSKNSVHVLLLTSKHR
ncbi:hypothetical protein HNY73_001127 [Argiope bruennichi]|uniref:Uncharacterized protein n=1 Tax=Argiope bruennichi TaxID=94029 RepID=A0A8T0G0B4_ARGBR|nr:hypothetical protein HNY73_001127 [Argiope bruennichi]